MFFTIFYTNLANKKEEIADKLNDLSSLKQPNQIMPNPFMPQPIISTINPTCEFIFTFLFFKFVLSRQL
jgi:hypothetical protein